MVRTHLCSSLTAPLSNLEACMRTSQCIIITNQKASGVSGDQDITMACPLSPPTYSWEGNDHRSPYHLCHAPLSNLSTGASSDDVKEVRSGKDGQELVLTAACRQAAPTGMRYGSHMGMHVTRVSQRPSSNDTQPILI